MARTATDPRAAPVSGWRLLRDRIIPRTALGLSTLFLFAAIGAAFSGAVLFAYYQWRLDQNEATLTSLVENFDDEVAGAKEEITADRDDATEQIRQELEPLQKLVASGETLEQLLEVVSPSMWFVVSRDEAGAPSVGSAFVVASDSEQSFLLTSYNTVRAVTRQPAPALTVRKGGEEVSATLWTWDESRDLALLVMDRRPQHRGDRRSRVRGVGPRIGWGGRGPGVGRRCVLGRSPARRGRGQRLPGWPGGDEPGRGDRRGIPHLLPVGLPPRRGVLRRAHPRLVRPGVALPEWGRPGGGRRATLIPRRRPATGRDGRA